MLQFQCWPYKSNDMLNFLVHQSKYKCFHLSLDSTVLSDYNIVIIIIKVCIWPKTCSRSKPTCFQRFSTFIRKWLNKYERSRFFSRYVFSLNYMRQVKEKQQTEEVENRMEMKDIFATCAWWLIERRLLSLWQVIVIKSDCCCLLPSQIDFAHCCNCHFIPQIRISRRLPELNI